MERRVVEGVVRAPGLYFNDVLVLAVTISILSIGAVYISFIADEAVPNGVVAGTSTGATIAVVFAWGAWWAGVIRAKFRKIREDIEAVAFDLAEHIREDSVDDLLARAEADGILRRIK